MLDYQECRLANDSPVACIWKLQGTSEAAQRIVPDGHLEMIFHLRNPLEQQTAEGWSTQSQSVTSGQLTRPVWIRARGETETIGIRLRAWAAPLFLRMPAERALDQIIETEVLEARGFAAIREAVFAKHTDVDGLATTARRAVAGLEHLCEPRVAAAVALAERTLGNATVDMLAAQAEVGGRQLGRLFQERVGMGPKLFLRVQRFRAAFARIGGPESLAAVAAGCRYADQSHMVKDFRRFAGCTPLAMRAEEAGLAGQLSAAPDDGFLQD